MGIAGWAPALTECARCAAPGPHRAFHVAAGGSVCVHCRPSGVGDPAAGRGGLDGRAQRRRLGARAGVAAVVPQPGQRAGRRPPASGTWNVSCGHCRWSNGRIGWIARSLTSGWPLFGQDVPHGNQKGEQTQYPQLPPAPDDYPTFPRQVHMAGGLPAAAAAYQRQVRPAAAAHVQGRRTADSRRPGTQPCRLSSWTATVDGPPSAGCTAPTATRWARRFSSTSPCGAIEIGIKHLTVYAFSTENWKRSTEEVRFLMGFNRDVGPQAAREPERHGRADALGGLASPHVAQRHQGVSTSPSR